MQIFIGADHQGAKLGKQITKHLQEQGFNAEYTKLVNTNTDDYPDFAFDVCKNVLKKDDNLGILICGNGIGISIAANKVKKIRCARVTTKEDAHHAKNHNGANVIAFGKINESDALEIIKTFIETPNPSEERHLRRIKKIIDYEEGA